MVGVGRLAIRSLVMAKSAARAERDYQQIVAAAVQKAKQRRKSSVASNQFRAEYAQTLKTGSATLSGVVGNGFKKDVTDSKWKRPYRDNEELERREELAQQKVAEKAKRVAPAFNKGGYQFISDGEDLTTLGRKV